MKKIYLLALAFLGCLTVNAQFIQTTTGKKNLNNSHSNTSANARQIAPTSPNQIASVLWMDDFSVPANWVIDHAVGTNSDWVIGFSVPGIMNPINSPSVANGYALFDSDSQCDTINGQVGNMTTANPIDLTGHPLVRLTFSQYYARYHDSTYIYVSNNGSTWTRFEVNGNLIVNDATLNPDMVTVDISSAAGNEDSVYIRFQFYSPDTNLTGPDTLAGCAYAWMIDDASIVDIPAIDGRIVTEAYGGEYSIIPKIQPEALSLRGRIINNGNNAFTGARINFTIFDAQFFALYSDSSAASGSVNPGDTSGVLNSVGSYSLPDTGLYYILQVVSLLGDSDVTNDSAIAIIYVDDSTYARDYAALVGGSDIFGSFGSNTATITMGQMFHIYHASEITSATLFLLANPAPAGDHLLVSVFDVLAGVPNTLLGSSPAYTITAADTGLLTLAFSSPISVGATDYFVAVTQVDNHNIRLAASANIYTPGTAFYKTGVAWLPIEGLTPPNNKFQFVLRANNPSGTLLGIDNPTKQSAFIIYPNPSSGMIYIAGTGKTENNVTVKVINSIGQVVKSMHYDSFTSDRLDLSKCPAGIYTVNFTSPTLQENKSIVLE